MKLKDVASKINKAWKTNVLTTADMIPECNRFSMGTLSADYALYGGLPEGKLVVYAGESGSGKSLLATLAMAQFQKAHPDKVCVYVDAEETLVGQIEWFVKMTGLDISEDHFMRYDCTGKAAEEIFEDIQAMQEAEDIGLIILDSAPMLSTKADMDNALSKDNGQRASVAKSMGKFLKFMVPSLAKTGNTLIVINHTRVAGTTFTGAKIYMEPCGYALNFYPTIKVRFAARKFTEGDKLDVAPSQTGEKTDGICTIFSVTKNRLGPLNRNGSKVVFRFDTGVDTLTDLIEIITKYEIAQRVTKQTWKLVNPITGEEYCDTETGEILEFRGKQAMIDYIKEHDEFRAEYEKLVAQYINGSSQDVSLIDEDSLAQILEMEKSVEQNMEEPDEDPIEDPDDKTGVDEDELEDEEDVNEDDFSDDDEEDFDFVLNKGTEE